MKYTLSITLLMLIALLLTACGDPTLDGSSDEAMKKSVQIILEELPDEKKERFKEILSGIYELGTLAYEGSNQSKDEVQAIINSKLEGKTANDIFYMIDEIKEGMNAKRSEWVPDIFPE